MKIKDIQMNRTETIPVLIKSVEQRESKKGPYCVLTITDGDTKTQATVWNTEKSRFALLIGQVVTARIRAQEYNGGKSLIMDETSIAYAGNEYSFRDFTEMPPKDPTEYRNEILQTCARCATPEQGDILAIVNHIYKENGARLLQWAAAKMVHHNLRGGLMQHTAAVVRNVEMLSDHEQYTFVNKGLAVCAAALHDVGKIYELQTDQFGESTYSLSGEMLGHTMISLSMIDSAQAELGIKVSENITLLKHCIAAHHGKKEWGAAATPMIPEAQLLFLADLIDARMYQYHAAMQDLEPGEITDRVVFGLDTKVYRPIE